MKLESKNLVKLSIVTTFFIWTDLIFNYSFPIHQLLLILTLILTGIYYIKNKKELRKVDFFKNKLNKILFVLLNLYIALDLVGILYSPVKKYSLTKYVVIVQMYILFILLIVNIRTKENLDKLFAAIGLGSIIMAVSTFLAYFGVINLYIPFYGRMCLISDYNLSATTILIGVFILILLIIRTVQKPIRKIVFIGIISFLSIPVVYNGDSRRGVMLLLMGFVLVGIYLICYFYKKQQINFKIILALSISVLIVTSSSLVLNKVLKNMSEKRIILNENTAKDDKTLKLEKGHDIVGRYKSIYKGGALSKRKAIWDISIREVKTYSIKDLFVGKGSGYSSYIYVTKYSKDIQDLYKNNEEPVLGGSHPHNLFLVDILDGGIIKLLVEGSIWIIILLQILYLVKFNKNIFIMSGIVWSCIFSNCLISGRYGFIYFKEFWLFACITCLLMYYEKTKLIDN